MFKILNNDQHLPQTIWQFGVNMHYVCIEDNVIVSILGYAPNVPDTVSVVEISDADAELITAQTSYFDLVTKTVKAVDASVTAQKTQDLANAEQLEFLRSTDWQILRHLRQQTLGQTTTLTDAEFLTLEQQRADAAASVI